MRFNQVRSHPRGEEQFGEAHVQGRGHLEVLLLTAHQEHPAAGSLDQPGVVGGLCENLFGNVERPFERPAAEHLRRLHGPEAAAVEGLRDEALAVGVLDGIGHGQGGDRRIGARLAFERGEHPLHERATEKRAGGIVDEDHLRGVSPAGRGECPPNGIRAHGASGDGGDAGRPVDPGRQREHESVNAVSRTQHVEAPLDERAPSQLDECLRPVCAEPLTASGGNDQGDGHRAVWLSRTRQTHRGAALTRAREPCYLATAIWLVAESASSSSR